MEAVAAKSPIEEFLREFDRRWLSPRTFSENLGAAVDYLKAGPTLKGMLPPAVVDCVERLAPRVSHVGFCVRKIPQDHVQGVLTAAGFAEQLVIPSALSPRRTLIVADGVIGRVEVALDDETEDPPHVAWQLVSDTALLDIGAALEGTLFSPPDFMKNMIAFNRDQHMMFRYFEGRIADHRLRLEFCW